MLALIGGGLAAYQHFNTVTSKQDDLRELETLYTSAQARLERKKADVEALQAKVTQTKTLISNDQEKKDLTAEIAQLEGARDAAKQKLADTLVLVRNAAAGTDWKDIVLANGQTITAVKIQKCTDTDVSLSHSGGVVKLASKDLPQDLQDRLGFGSAVQINP